MSIALYDKALLDKLKVWTNGTNVSIVAPDESTRLFEMIADNNNDNAIKLPIISLKRPRGFTILKPQKSSMSFNGITVEKREKSAITINAIPINIDYQIDVYTRYIQEADEYIRNFVYNIINYPKLTVDIPYNGVHLKHDSNIRLTPEIEDNSDIPERLISGQFTRLTMNIYIDDAYLWDLPIRGYKSIDTNDDGGLQIINGENPTMYVETL